MKQLVFLFLITLCSQHWLCAQLAPGTKLINGGGSLYWSRQNNLLDMRYQNFAGNLSASLSKFYQENRSRGFGVNYFYTQSFQQNFSPTPYLSRNARQSLYLSFADTRWVQLAWLHKNLYVYLTKGLGMELGRQRQKSGTTAIEDQKSHSLGLFGSLSPGIALMIHERWVLNTQLAGVFASYSFAFRQVDGKTDVYGHSLYFRPQFGLDDWQIGLSYRFGGKRD